MENFKQREYYKIFTGTNQEDGHDKVYLGYEGYTTEQTFKKDTVNYFHIPFFAETGTLSANQLALEGSTPGPIPYMADRIQEKLGGYSNTTHWGNPTDQPNGTWLCSWLYAISGETPVWLDRYYNPGKVSYQEALLGQVSYTINNPAYQDLPSSLKLDAGVWYQYFHHGEKSAADIVSTFNGDDNNRLRLGITSWSAEPQDISNYQNKILISNFKDNWALNLVEPDVTDSNSLNFDNSDFIDTRVIYNSSYNLQDDFTINFWVRNKNWADASGSQLLGNLNNGGYGVFFDNLKYYPFFVVPESFYGHLFYFNQEGINYYDLSLQPFTTNTPEQSGVSQPVQVGINSNSEVIVVDAGAVDSFYKLNHVGDVIAIPKTNANAAYLVRGTPKLLAIDGQNNNYVVTTFGTYIFDQNLIFVNVLSGTSDKYVTGDQIAFDINGVLQKESNCIDLKFDSNNNKWAIKNDGNLYCNNTLLSSLPIGGTNLAIDPEDNLWLLYAFNKIIKIDTKTQQPIKYFTVGTEDSINNEKNISFIYSYDRAKQTKTWYALIYHNNEKVLYQVTLDGFIKRSTTLPLKLNVKQTPPTSQEKQRLTFNCRGDFTGYEWKRIFNNVLYNNNNQIQFKISGQKPIKNDSINIFTLSVPVQYLTNNTWHLITCTYNTNVMKIFINGRLRDSLQIPGNYNVRYFRKNDLYIGTPCGKITNYNYEIASQALIFDGYIDNIRIYDYAIRPEFIDMFIRERFAAQNVIWNIPTARLQYVEGIERFFKHKLPGAKSPFFKVKVSGLQITDPNIRAQIEVAIKAAIEQTKPAYTELISVEWVD